MAIGKMLSAAKKTMSRALNAPAPRATGSFKPSMPMVDAAKVAAASSRMGNMAKTAATSSKAKSGALGSAPKALKGVAGLAGAAAKTMMKKGGAVKKAKPRSKK